MSEPIFFEMEDGTTYCSMAEYDRLRETVEQLQGGEYTHQYVWKILEERSAALERIEELESPRCIICGKSGDTGAKHQGESLCECGGRVFPPQELADLLNERQASIEELEEQARLRELDFNVEFQGHHITTDQIDKAWGIINKCDDAGWLDAVNAIMAVFENLGIVECERCNGHGMWEYDYDDQEIGATVKAPATCPTCNGHGGVKEDDDE